MEDRIPETRASSKRSILKLMQDGVLDQAEFVGALGWMGVDMSRDEVKLLFSFLDDSGDGEIEGALN